MISVLRDHEGGRGEFSNGVAVCGVVLCSGGVHCSCRDIVCASVRAVWESGRALVDIDGDRWGCMWKRVLMDRNRKRIVWSVDWVLERAV
jgi:hypothetical protein